MTPLPPRIVAGRTACRANRERARIGLTILLAVGAVSSQAAELAWTDLTVRVYYTGTFATPHEATALAVAERTLRGADLRVHWMRCHAGGVRACTEPLGRGDVALRLVRGTSVPRRAPEITLGDTMVDTVLRRASLATVYLDRVEHLARAAGADAATLLGRAIAHELFHAAAGSSHHAPWGLMRARWSRHEVARDDARDWEFRREDRARLHTGRRPAATVGLGE